MKTSLKVSVEVKEMLETMKINKNETYEDIILELIEDHLELNPKFKKEIEKALKEIEKGETFPFQEVLKGVKSGNRVYKKRFKRFQKTSKNHSKKSHRRS